jgi:Leucine-rich repeat (LRR) protein
MNQLTNLRGIENLRNLEILRCYRNQLTSLRGIENLNNLKILSCYNNQFTKEYKNYLIEWCKEKNIKLTI